MRARAEHGFTLVEVLIAMLLMSVGIAATLGVFGSSGRASVAAQNTDIAAQQAQATIDLLSRMPYNQIGLTSTPASSTNPLNPGSRVSGTPATLTIKSGLAESFVLSSDTGQSAAAIDPTPTTFSVGTGNGTTAGKIYRYVTWRDDNCPAGICDGSKNTKRITVAVTIGAVGALAARPPIWISQVIPDPDSLAPGVNPPSSSGGGGGSGTTAQDFYLYDTRCGNNTRQSQSGDHITHNTASSGPSPSYYSICENTTLSGAMQPDLMGTTPPPGGASTPLYTYSSELGGGYTGGLAMKRQGSTCKTFYSASDTVNPNAANAWSIHAWSTAAFTSTFTLAGQATVSIFSSTIGGASGRGLVCATLIDRQVFNGVPQDTTVGSTTYDLATWPADVRRLSFTFSTQNVDIAANHRLVLVLGVRGESDNDLNFVYDHPHYDSFLELATSTPLP